MDEDDQRQEEQATAETELIDAARMLVEDFDYPRSEVIKIIEATCKA
jgi:hypothetical protein